MKLRERLAACDRVQRSRRYKVIATVAVAVLAIAAAVTALYFQQRFGGGEIAAAAAAEDTAYDAFVAATGSDFTEEEQLARRDAWLDAAMEASRLRVERAGEGWLIGPGVLSWAFPGIAAITGVSIVSVWLGLSLTYLGVLAVGMGAAAVVYLVPGLRDVGVFILAALPLFVALLTMLELARLLLAPSHPVTAIARNVLSEAVRMKIGIVFIAFLVLLLALIPLVLEADQPLRFRVQQWIQYGAGLGYGVLLLLTAAFSCASVAFEQRDRRIWQTATKPVAAWQYVFGKWIGVMVLNLVLLSVIASSVFMFTQYLRFQKAEGEIDAFITEQGFDSRDIPAFMTDDRRKLENEVLIARASVKPEPPPLLQEAVDERTAQIIETQRRNAPGLPITPEIEAAARAEAIGEFSDRYYSIPRIEFGRPGSRQYFFEGLGEIAEDRPDATLTLRYRVIAGSNDPSQVYRVAFLFNNQPWPPAQALGGRSTAAQAGVRQVALDTIQLIEFPTDLLSEDGRLVVEFFNHPSNLQEIRIPPEDLEIVYPVGGYELNFARAMMVLWVKLGFVAAVGIACSTFLGFPTALLLTFGIMFASESAGFIAQSLEYYSSITRDGDVRWDKLIARNLSRPVAWLFGTYAELTPIERLASGRLLGWGDLGMATAQVAAWAAGILTLGTVVFRRRELAIYSGS